MLTVSSPQGSDHTPHTNNLTPSETVLAAPILRDPRPHPKHPRRPTPPWNQSSRRAGGDDLPGHRRLLPSPCGAARLHWWREGRRRPGRPRRRLRGLGRPEGAASSTSGGGWPERASASSSTPTAWTCSTPTRSTSPPSPDPSPPRPSSGTSAPSTPSTRPTASPPPHRPTSHETQVSHKRGDSTAGGAVAFPVHPHAHHD